MSALLFDRIPWLSPAKNGPMTVAVEVRAMGHIRIIPKDAVDQLLAAQVRLAADVIRRTFVGRISEDGRLSLPDILAGTVFPEWPNKSAAIKVLIECHASHFDLMSPDAWLAIVGQGPDIEELLDQE